MVLLFSQYKNCLICPFSHFLDQFFFYHQKAITLRGEAGNTSVHCIYISIQKGNRSETTLYLAKKPVIGKRLVLSFVNE